MGSGVLIKEDLEKYGVENFSKEILFEASSSEEMFEKERELIELHQPELNIHPGGCGGWEYINYNNLKHKFSSNHYKKIGKNGGFSTQDKIRNNPNYAYLKQYYFKKGNSLSATAFKGKKHTEETKRKIGEANSIHQRGENNHQYGTMWITNGSKNKKIQKDQEIPDGWRKGRTIKKSSKGT